MDHQTEELKWQAIKTNDASYDGVFYYGVKSTGIFCRPSCKSKVPLRENVIFFANAQEAVEKGFRPCKRCRPDCDEPVNGMLNVINEKVIPVLQTEYSDPDLLRKLPSMVGISSFYLQRLFKHQTGVSPKVFLQTTRISKAKELLEKQELNSAEICFTVGFQSLSTFYAVFRGITGVSPGAYQRKFIKNIAGGKDEAGIR